MSKHPPSESENDENELPFLEISDEAPEEWTASKNSHSTTPETQSAQPFNSPIIELRPRRSIPPRQSLIQHPQFKIIALTGGILLTLMVFFRIPPILIFIGVFSVLRVLFIPLALVGFIWWVTRLYSPTRR